MYIVFAKTVTLPGEHSLAAFVFVSYCKRNSSNMSGQPEQRAIKVNGAKVGFKSISGPVSGSLMTSVALRKQIAKTEREKK